ncbi:hypothetical protein GpartN1_g24.t1 [Galdieria partita]|uniref:2-methoxy-6-polyprenyl-1,4-benzoquinol methylase, mitochondrial n=1 Tax=Galdieria partita TaxID=83374 RepID=A0A9C7PPI4_9RHOD|nr:hypothetical protein GpartN1_g24.t1 [Galdieria partita]
MLCVVVLLFLVYRRRKSLGKSFQSYPRLGSGEMFDHIADYYDGMNRLISLGLDMSWRRSAVRHLTSLPLHSTILDVAMGTGDLSLALLQRRPDYHIVGIDPSLAMLRRAEHKLKYSNIVQGVAEGLPFADGTFSAVMVAFGVRNFEDRKKGILEMRRVMRDDGTMVIIELGYPDDKNGKWCLRWISVLAKLFIGYIVPCLGSCLVRSGEEYHYLQQSMYSFPDAATFQHFLQTECELCWIHYERCFLGVGPHIYVLRKQLSRFDGIKLRSSG